MPEKLSKKKHTDKSVDDEEDAKIMGVDLKSTYKPSPQSRFDLLQLMPPPSGTSVVASKALGKEFKNLIKLQEEGQLPFYLNPDTDR